MRVEAPGSRRRSRIAQSTADWSLASIYERRIGDASSSNEVMEWWLFSAGVVHGFLGLVLYSLTAAATLEPVA